MTVITQGKVYSEEEILQSTSNCNGQCSSDSSWCTYNPNTNCWNNGD